MKKIMASVLFLFMVTAAGAQTKVTKTNVVGKWVMYSLEVPGQLYYNLERDSLMVNEKLKASMTPEQQALMNPAIRQQFAMFSKVSFQFKSDGTVELVSPTGEAEKGTYVVDEKNATITTKTKNGDKAGNVLSKANLINPTHLEFTSPGDDGNVVHLVLKKGK